MALKIKSKFLNREWRALPYLAPASSFCPAPLKGPQTLTPNTDPRHWPGLSDPDTDLDTDPRYWSQTLTWTLFPDTDPRHLTQTLTWTLTWMVTPYTNALSGVGPWGHMLLSAGNILPAGLAQCTFAHTCERINKAKKGIEKAEKGE